MALSTWERDTDGSWTCAPGEIVQPLSPMEEIWSAMVLGLKDYVEKNGFPGVLIGLSGGIDSALSAAVAVDALGADRVHCIMMPSPYTSAESHEDAEADRAAVGRPLSEHRHRPGHGRLRRHADRSVGRWRS